ncbi:hypothetical protein CCACVL1_13064 [Corchorus capsularis]|uniref:Uncharacterized protein n=1 Tax=Corchorus capsularis TaxID=210143 RepID=A0A1R3ICH2_COCAP|nr:hypothetical protein CCACVL1_13064 [Corchorus capsularis]
MEEIKKLAAIAIDLNVRLHALRLNF